MKKVELWYSTKYAVHWFQNGQADGYVFALRELAALAGLKIRIKIDGKEI
jgi:hypothetical protein